LLWNIFLTQKKGNRNDLYRVFCFQIGIIGLSFAQQKKGECKVVLRAGSKSISKTHKNKSLKACKNYTRQVKKVSGASYGTFNGKKVKVSKQKTRRKK